MKNIILSLIFVFIGLSSYAQYDNSEKFSIMAGFVSTGSDYVFWSDNTYGGNVQLVYDVKKIHEGAITLKASGAFSSGYQGYYGGVNFRMGSRFFADTDLLFGYSSISNLDLLDSYGKGATEYKGGAFVWNIGLGYRLMNPLFLRLAYGGHFPMGHVGLNTAIYIQLGYRIK